MFNFLKCKSTTGLYNSRSRLYSILNFVCRFQFAWRLKIERGHILLFGFRLKHMKQIGYKKTGYGNKRQKPSGFRLMTAFEGDHQA